jgi:predicted nucleotidyltransferase component of viral defense system
MQNEYYIHKLYPLQDKVLRQIETLETSFYLTGDTALSRCYFHHRYSDDLDFFMNASPNFSDQGDRIINHINKLGWNLKVGARSVSYYRLFVTEDDTTLKLIL